MACQRINSTGPLPEQTKQNIEVRVNIARVQPKMALVDLDQYSSYDKLLRVTARVKCFIDTLQNKTQHSSCYLDRVEVDWAETSQASPAHLHFRFLAC